LRIVVISSAVFLDNLKIGHDGIDCLAGGEMGIDTGGFRAYGEQWAELTPKEELP